MTRHAYIDGDPTNPGHIYFEQDGARLRCELEPDDVIAALDAHMEHTGIVDAMAQEIENLRAELDGREKVTNNPNDPKLSTPRGPTLPCGGMTVNYVGEPEHWSPWLEWRGGPCPLPDGVTVEVELRLTKLVRGLATEFLWRHFQDGADILRFRYCPAGWLPLGKFIPPAELWDEGCPVRVHIRTANGGEGWAQRCPRDWDGITHIRLVARQPQAGLPEGWKIRKDGALIPPHGIHAFTVEDRRQFGSAVIRQAVDAWLRETGDE